MVSSKTTSGKYMRVGDKKGPLVIGGARKKMEEDPTFMYVPLYKVAGPQEDVSKWLGENHPEKSKEALRGSYSLSTLKNKNVREAFNREVENATEERASASHTRSEMRQVNLMVLVRLLKMYDQQKKVGDTKVTTGSSVSHNDLKVKVKSLASEGKVLDVTNMKTKGTEGKKMVFKEGSSRRRISQEEGDPFYNIVYNPSNKSSSKGVRNFLKNYGGFEDSQIDNLVDAVESGSMINISRGKSPTRSPLVSPSRRQRSPRRNKAREEQDFDDLLDNLPH